MTYSSPGTSSPREATSVATSTCASPVLNLSSTEARAFCVMSPWSATAPIFRFCSTSAISRASLLYVTNTSTWGGFASSLSSAKYPSTNSQSRLRRAAGLLGTASRTCVTLRATERSCPPTVSRTAPGRSSRSASGCSAAGHVALAKTVWGSWGSSGGRIRPAMALTEGVNPKSSRRSHSSKTHICSDAREHTAVHVSPSAASSSPCPQRASRRPGVATSTSGLTLKSLACWAPNGDPPTAQSTDHCVPHSPRTMRPLTRFTMVSATAAICMPNSRVGAMTRARGCTWGESVQ
mmetsp:Transcript_46062/g.75422  ORF Transcript_46062/g.75422 Transcript_46062/m.75422 type:complete len:293 (-) Transcript_46062:167-1045(-)